MLLGDFKKFTLNDQCVKEKLSYRYIRICKNALIFFSLTNGILHLPVTRLLLHESMASKKWIYFPFHRDHEQWSPIISMVKRCHCTWTTSGIGHFHSSWLPLPSLWRGNSFLPIRKSLIMGPPVGWYNDCRTQCLLMTHAFIIKTAHIVLKEVFLETRCNKGWRAWL